jgi:hypothetical protein
MSKGIPPRFGLMPPGYSSEPLQYLKDSDGNIFEYCRECGKEVMKYISIYPIWLKDREELIHVAHYKQTIHKLTAASTEEVTANIVRMRNTVAGIKDRQMRKEQEDILIKEWDILATKLEKKLWDDNDFVPQLNANPQYWMSGKWKKGTNSTGPK